MPLRPGFLVCHSSFVMNGFSDLIRELWGDEGHCASTAVGGWLSCRSVLLSGLKQSSPCAYPLAIRPTWSLGPGLPLPCSTGSREQPCRSARNGRLRPNSTASSARGQSHGGGTTFHPGAGNSSQSMFHFRRLWPSEDSVATEDEIDPGHDPVEVGGRDPPDAFSEDFAVDRDDLRDVGNRVLGQSGG